MDYSKEKDSTIFYLKFLQALMVCDDIDLFLQEADDFGIHYTSLSLLQMLRDLVNGYTLKRSLPVKITQNIFDFVSICRSSNEEETVEERKNRVNVCNEIICKLNASSEKEEYPFYPSLINGFYKNPIERIYNHILYNRNREDMQTLLEYYFGLEYYILYSHTELVGEEEFLEFLAPFLVNDRYLEVINFLLEEIPELLEDPIFIKRLRQILQENENLYEIYKGHEVEDSIAELEDDDEQIIKDKYFWKLQKKVKARVNKIKRDS